MIENEEKNCAREREISASTIVKMDYNKLISVELLAKIYLTAECTANDVLIFLEVYPENEPSKASE